MTPLCHLHSIQLVHFRLGHVFPFDFGLLTVAFLSRWEGASDNHLSLRIQKELRSLLALHLGLCEPVQQLLPVDNIYYHES